MDAPLYVNSSTMYYTMEPESPDVFPYKAKMRRTGMVLSPLKKSLFYLCEGRFSRRDPKFSHRLVI